MAAAWQRSEAATSERASEREGGREETRTRTTQELNRRGDEALTFGGVQGVKEREV